MAPMERILVPIDFSAASRHALEYAIFLAERFEARIEVVHIHDPPQYVGDLPVQVQGEPPVALAEYVHERAKSNLDRALAEVKTSVPVTGRVATGRVHHEIVRIATDERFDLVVMGTHGREGLSRFILGSVAEQIVRRATCPVVTVHGPESASGEG